MANLGRQVAVSALLLGGVAIIASMFFSGTPRLGGYGSLSSGHGGMMGGHGGMMGGHGGMMGGYGGMMGGFGGMMGGFGTGWSFFGMLGQLGFLLLLVGGGYLLYRALVDDGGARQYGTGDTAMEELRRAYARGELSDEQFERRRTRLHRGGDP